MSLGVRIKRLRHLRGLTQRELATMVGVSPGYIQALESNKRTGSLELMRKLADALGTDLSSLLDEAQRKQSKVYLDDLLSDEGTENLVQRTKARSARHSDAREDTRRHPGAPPRRIKI